MEWTIGWLGCGIIAALIAMALNRSAFCWFFVGAIFGPFAFLFLLIAGKNR
jgi:hypothetical protein